MEKIWRKLAELDFSFLLTSFLTHFKSIWVKFLPKSNLRPVLGLHRGPLGPQKSQIKLTIASFLSPNQMEHTVAVDWVLCQSLKLLLTEYSAKPSNSCWQSNLPNPQMAVDRVLCQTLKWLLAEYSAKPRQWIYKQINKTKYFRLRRTDEVSSERPKRDLRET